MTLILSDHNCKSYTTKKRFGICDDPPPPHKKAYIDYDNESKWIADVINDKVQLISFTSIDHCIEIRDRIGKMIKRCDGVLTYDKTIIFVELKERNEKGSKWVKDAEMQLISTITHFEKSGEAQSFKVKKAYISNSKKPWFRESQQRRMDKFFEKTRYVLRIEKEIKI